MTHARSDEPCAVTVGGREEGFPHCDEPATYKCQNPPRWYLCDDHMKFALIAGWDPQPLETTDA